MIVVYPMLISQSVSPTVLPGLIKAVEKYILVYNSDQVLRAASTTSAGNIISTGAQVVGGAVAAGVGAAITGKVLDRLKDSRNLSDSDLDEIIEAYTKSNQTTKTYKTKSGDGEKTVTSTSGKTSAADFRPTPGAKPSLDIPSRGEGLTLEPTWMTVTTARKGVQILGVKVVPFRVKSTDNLTKLLMNDSQLKTLESLTTKFGRAITRVVYRLIRKVPTLRGATVTGDPKKDILYASSKFKDNMFLCLSTLDLESTEIFNTPQGVRKLQQLGWMSMILMDDVNRRATFCMKEFSGVCSVVPYNYMFASFGKDINKAYEDLEDLKKSSGPFFNMRTNRKRAFTENKNIDLNYHLDVIQEK